MTTGDHIHSTGLHQRTIGNVTNLTLNFGVKKTVALIKMVSDGMSQTWTGENNWVVPPHSIIPAVVSKIAKEHANATLVIPVWKSAPFWPSVWKSVNFIDIVTDFQYFPGENFTHRGLGKIGVFGRKSQKFNFVALRIRFL